MDAKIISAAQELAIGIPLDQVAKDLTEEEISEAITLCQQIYCPGCS